MVASVLAAMRAASVEAAVGGNVSFVTHDRIDLRRLTGLVKLQRPVQIAMIGERQRVHTELFSTAYQLSDRTGTVQQTVVAVAMQMNKRRRQGGSLLANK